MICLQQGKLFVSAWFSKQRGLIFIVLSLLSLPQPKVKNFLMFFSLDAYKTRLNCIHQNIILTLEQRWLGSAAFIWICGPEVTFHKI
jgi:hypothetical protein